MYATFCQASRKVLSIELIIKRRTLKFKNEKLLEVSLYVFYNQFCIQKLTRRLTNSPGTLVDNHCIRYIVLKNFIIPGLVSPPFCVWLVWLHLILLLLFLLYKHFLETVLRIWLCSCLSPNFLQLMIE
jgi:hypothetical protein